MSFEEKNLYGQYIDNSEKNYGPRASPAPILGLIFYNIRIYSRCQVSVYRTIGPLVCFVGPICAKKVQLLHVPLIREHFDELWSTTTRNHLDSPFFVPYMYLFK